MFDTQEISNMIVGFATYKMLETYIQNLKNNKEQRKEISDVEGDRAKLIQNKVKMAKAKDDMDKLRTDRQRRDIEDTAKKIQAKKKLEDAVQQVKEDE